jgi:glutamyl/glutaminyl-tRNA synthetase
VGHARFCPSPTGTRTEANPHSAVQLAFARHNQNKLIFRTEDTGHPRLLVFYGNND